MPTIVTILGSGDAFGTPKPGCKRDACKTKGLLNHRTRFGVLVEINGKRLQFDAGPDLRGQYLREAISFEHVDAVFLTHKHFDHTGGLGEFDSIGVLPPIPLFCHPRVFEEINGYFGHLFRKNKLQHREVRIGKEFRWNGIRIKPFELNHHKCFCVGYRVTAGNKTVVIATDTNANLPQATLKAMSNADLLVIDGMAQSIEQIYLAKRDLSNKPENEFKKTFAPEKRGHMLISEALVLSQKLKAKNTVVVGISHYNQPHLKLDKTYQNKTFRIGYDGLKISI